VVITEAQLYWAIDDSSGCVTITIDTSSYTGDPSVQYNGIQLTGDFDGNGKTLYIDGTKAKPQAALAVNSHFNNPTGGVSPTNITISNVTLVGGKYALNLNGNNTQQNVTYVDTTVTLDGVTIQGSSWYAMAVQDTTKVIFKDTTIDAPILAGYDRGENNVLSFDFSGLDWTTASPSLAFVLDHSNAAPQPNGDLALGCISTPDKIKNLPSQYEGTNVDWSTFITEPRVQYSCHTVHFDANPPAGLTATGTVADMLADDQAPTITLPPASAYHVAGYTLIGWGTDTVTDDAGVVSADVDIVALAAAQLTKGANDETTLHAIWQKDQTPPPPEPCTSHCTDTGGSVVTGTALPYALGGVLLVCAAGVAFVTRRRWARS